MKADSIRLFVAIGFPPPIIDQLVRCQQNLDVYSRQARWVERKNLHLTLQFVGETPLGLLPDLALRLRTIALQHQPILLSFEAKLRFFGQSPDFRVAWIGIQSTDNALGQLQSSIALETASCLGVFKKESFRAHVTLARDVRLKNEAVRPRTDQVVFPVEPVAAFVADRFCLMSSNAGQGKLAYQLMEEFRLERKIFS